MKSPLCGKTFVLDISHNIRFKEKSLLIKYLREQNANISHILTASTDYVLVKDDVDTYKTRRAKQLGITLLNVEYIYECQRNLDKIVNPDPYVITSAEDKEHFKSGLIPAESEFHKKYIFHMSFVTKQ
ncbi:unnamed protein product [Didymodactylos carnosus]|uniref:BRCT domain-containing protein n=1 Tax=Didymodactylos carnosus TaxID=1234261 RepID=A0A815V6E0_9BILA|nr:unnamed protein product [Didymodactylos carnosus]CAF4384272.1 unnamed protein product [Didymodactylos carnosus]